MDSLHCRKTEQSSVHSDSGGIYAMEIPSQVTNKMCLKILNEIFSVLVNRQTTIPMNNSIPSPYGRKKDS